MNSDARSPAASTASASANAAAARPPRSDFIERSHQRSAALGLSRGEKYAVGPMVRTDLRLARERNQRLHLHAAPVMHMLFEQIIGTDSMIVLTDAQGTILHSVGDDDFLQRADKVALAPGENWAEHAKGTNAIGTALFEGTPTLVHADEHFRHANSFLTCSAAPIFDPRGNMLGVLDVTGDHRSYHRHTMGLVRMSARMIENHWLSDDCTHRLRLHFHSRVEFIGSLLEGILVVGPDGHIVGANRGALDQLGSSGAALRAHSLGSLFGTTPAAVYDHFRAPLPGPMRLCLPNGQAFFVTARFDWPSRPVVAGLGLATAEAAPVPLHVPAAAARPVARAAAQAVPPESGLQQLLTGDAQVALAVQKLRRILDRDIPLLILGDTGTGKATLARAFHHDSQRARQPFVAVNCAAMTDTLIEAELFGQEDGGSPGALRRSAPGRIVQAHGGTLFLAEVGELPLGTQARLLRVLQERCVTPVSSKPPGSRKAIPVDIAVVSSSRRNLREMIERREFREDLYGCLNGLAVRLPALRERSDLDALVQRVLAAQGLAETPALDAEVQALFRQCAWPGNLRQLTNLLRTAAVVAEGERLISTAHLSDDFLEDARRAGEARAAAADARRDGDVAAAPASAAPTTLERAEIEMIRQALDAAGGNISAASKQLGISRNTIYRKLRWNVPRQELCPSIPQDERR